MNRVQGTIFLATLQLKFKQQFAYLFEQTHNSYESTTTPMKRLQWRLLGRTVEWWSQKYVSWRQTKPSVWNNLLKIKKFVFARSHLHGVERGGDNINLCRFDLKAVRKRFFWSRPKLNVLRNRKQIYKYQVRQYQNLFDKQHTFFRVG